MMSDLWAAQRDRIRVASEKLRNRDYTCDEGVQLPESKARSILVKSRSFREDHGPKLARSKPPGLECTPYVRLEITIQAHNSAPLSPVPRPSPSSLPSSICQAEKPHLPQLSRSYLRWKCMHGHCKRPPIAPSVGLWLSPILPDAMVSDKHLKTVYCPAKARTNTVVRALARSDNDMYSHLNNTTYSHLYDSIISTYLLIHCSLSLPSSPVAEHSPSQIGLVVSSTSQYFAPISFPAIVELGLRIEQLGKTSVTYEVGVFQEGCEHVRAVGGFTHVFVDRESKRPSLEGMPATIRNGLQRLKTSHNLGIKGNKAQL